VRGQGEDLRPTFFHAIAGRTSLYVFETHGTLLHGKRVSVDLIVHVLACLVEGLRIQAEHGCLSLTPNTVLGWLGEAAEPLRAFLRYCLHALHRTQVQLDELCAVLRAVGGRVMVRSCRYTTSLGIAEKTFIVGL
jgi:hypothetical protein